MEDEVINQNQEEDRVYYSGLAVGFEIYFNVVIRNTQAMNPEVGVLPNIGAIYADKLNELNEDFAKRGISFRNSALGRLIRLHFTIIMFRAMHSLQKYNSAMMRAKMAQSAEMRQQALTQAEAFLNQYKELCQYMMSYSLSKNLDNTIENSEEMYKSEGYSDEEIKHEKDAVQEERKQLGNLDEKKENEAQQDATITGREIKEEDTKDELIPGTNIKRPRDRGVYETDEEYVDFLRDYYDKVFPGNNKARAALELAKETNNQIRLEDTKDEFIPGTNIKKPRDREVHETDEEYNNFLKDYYGKVYPQKETVTPNQTHQAELNQMMQETPASNKVINNAPKNELNQMVTQSQQPRVVGVQPVVLQK